MDLVNLAQSDLKRFHFKSIEFLEKQKHFYIMFSQHFIRIPKISKLFWGIQAVFPPPEILTFSLEVGERVQIMGLGQKYCRVLWQGRKSQYSPAVLAQTSIRREGRGDGNQRREKHHHQPKTQGEISGLRHWRQIKVGKYRKENLMLIFLNKLMAIFWKIIAITLWQSDFIHLIKVIKSTGTGY